jgi:hypothetical protein
MSKTTVTHKDVEILDLPTPANFTVGSKLISEYVAAMDSALGGSSAKYVKEALKIQLDAPSTPVILPGASHTYSINLGVAYEHLAICNFEWVQPALNEQSPNVVVGSASFPDNKFGGILIVNTTPGGWVRGFKHEEPEFMDGSSTEIYAPFYARSSDVSAAMGYGSQPLEVSLDHAVLQTNPPKKLQIQDAYLEGTNLKITIKNVDSVALDLSAYVGLTALIDGNKPSQMGAVAENGTIVYTHSDAPPTPVTLRISEDAGATFQSKVVPSQYPFLAGIAATSNSMNTFIGMINYEYIRTAQSPDYTITDKFPIQSTLGNQITFSLGGNLRGVPNHGDKVFDWKKTDTESTALFSAFLNYNDIVVYKSVDDCLNFGANSPSFDDALPILKASEDIADFQRASATEGAPNSNSPFHNLVKAQVKVIDSNTHYLNMTYLSKVEPLNTGQPVKENYFGAQTIVGNDGIDYQIRSDEAALNLQSYVGVPAFGFFNVSNSTVGNDGPRATVGNVITGSVNPLFMGPGTWGTEAIVTDANQIIVDAADWAALPETPLIGDHFQVSGINVFQPTLYQVQDATITIYGLTNHPVKILTFRSNTYQTGGHQSVSQPIPTYDGLGSPIPEVSWAHVKATGRLIYVNGRLLSVFRSIANGGGAPATLTPESDVNTAVTFVADTNCIKQKLLKTSDGGQTWTSIMEDPEFRYGIASVFHASNDGQTLLLASMRYWQGTGYEKWPYPSTMGNEARFNMSTDGGSTWKNSTGLWDKIADNLTRVTYFGTSESFAIRRMTGQVGSKIDNTVLFVLYKGLDLQNPYLYRSTDNGTTWQDGVQLSSQHSGNQFLSYHNDSKDQFMAFCGSAYITAPYQFVFYGALVDKFTQWPTYGVTA